MKKKSHTPNLKGRDISVQLKALPPLVLMETLGPTSKPAVWDQSALLGKYGTARALCYDGPQKTTVISIIRLTQLKKGSLHWCSTSLHYINRIRINQGRVLFSGIMTRPHIHTAGGRDKPELIVTPEIVSWASSPQPVRPHDSHSPPLLFCASLSLRFLPLPHPPFQPCFPCLMGWWLTDTLTA